MIPRSTRSTPAGPHRRSKVGKAWPSSSAATTRAWPSACPRASGGRTPRPARGVRLPRRLRPAVERQVHSSQIDAPACQEGRNRPEHRRMGSGAVDDEYPNRGVSVPRNRRTRWFRQGHHSETGGTSDFPTVIGDVSRSTPRAPRTIPKSRNSSDLRRADSSGACNTGFI